ncbi:MAG: tRNA threonylcarbamoyladenosine dehydratase [Clostridiales bacterium]|nr:tRNA threonylcarbamoyladenosine dehydratase [Clostridiales bacterium]
MLNQFSRTELLLGGAGMERLARARVAVFGLGGVGGYTAEALARSGVGAIDLFDDDRICVTNLNRQIFATRKTVGLFKTEAAAARLTDINPDLTATEHRLFYTPQNADGVDLSLYDYIADAVDTVSAKLELAARAEKANIPIIACMGAGNKLDASAFRVADIYETSVCPLAKVMRNELRKRGVQHLKVVYSREEPLKPAADGELTCKNKCVCPPGTKRTCAARRQIPGSNAFAPAAAGLIMAGEIVRGLAGFD